MIANTLSAISDSAFGAFLARAYVEFEAFFEEAQIAIARANAEAPFGH